MQKRLDIQKTYARFKDSVSQAGSFFRQKMHYSADEKIAFIADFHHRYGALEKLFDDDELLKTGKSVTLSPGSEMSKVVLSKRSIEQEFEAAICVMYFNLSVDEIDALEAHARRLGKLREALIMKKMFAKYMTSTSVANVTV